MTARDPEISAWSAAKDEIRRVLRMPAKIRHAKAGGPPDNWEGLQVRDLDSGELVTDVVEVWSDRGIVHRFTGAIAGGNFEIERVRGRFAIEEVAADAEIPAARGSRRARG